MSIAIIAGLGNPGLKYRNTRHNLGFSLIDSLADSLGATWKTKNRFQAKAASVDINNQTMLLLKPLTFMNDSGVSLKAVLDYKKLPATSLLILYDDINLEFGRVKLSAGGSAGGHNGVSSILSQIEPNFFRYRMGIGLKPDKHMDLSEYVLGKFSSGEQKLLAEQASIYLEHLQLIIDKGPVLAMNLINQRIVLTHERNNQQQL